MPALDVFSFHRFVMFDPSTVTYGPETPRDGPAVDALCCLTFGPGRFARAAERVRERASFARGPSHIAVYGGRLLGSVRTTPIAVGAAPVLMLGPLAVHPDFAKRGIGKHLTALAAEEARKAGETIMLLVGDLDYYGPLGYRRVPPGQVTMPGPVDPARLLALSLTGADLRGMSGLVGPRV